MARARRAGRVVRPVLFQKFDLESKHTYYFVFSSRSRSSPRRLAHPQLAHRSRLVGNRDNTRRAQSYGVSPAELQLTAFAISGLMAGLAGALFMYNQHGFQRATILDPEQHQAVFAMGVIGGLSSVPAPSSAPPT